MSLPNFDNRNLSLSPNGTKIGFMSALSTGGGLQLYSINNDGTDLKQLTKDGCLSFSWSPNQRIVYANFDEYHIDKTKGTLWIMDADGNNKQPLTYNRFEIKQ